MRNLWIAAIAATGLFVACDQKGADNVPQEKVPAVQKKAPEAKAAPEVKKVVKPTEASKAAAPAVAPKDPMYALFAPLPADMAGGKDLSVTRTDLGRMLYFDKRMSKNHDLSCNSCHGLDTFGVDNKPLSSGHKGQLGGRNSPTVYNAAGHISQFWDGREPDVEAQAKGPVLNPVEMAMPNPARVIETLKSMPGYVTAFKAAFPGEADPVTYDNFGKAVGAFERKLVTPGRWDRFLAGETSALSDAEKKGFELFTKTGCATCHMGAYVGGTMYQKVGLVKPWPNLKDKGRFDATKKAEDTFFFKVPTLRNVEKTGPYFHDGGVADLTVAVKMMGEYQLGRILTDAEAASIVTWLNVLTGTPDAAYIAAPKLPASTDKTPKPDPS